VPKWEVLAGNRAPNDGHNIEGGIDSNDEGEVGSEEEVVQLIMETEGSVPIN
jgi:hypothetical protein